MVAAHGPDQKVYMFPVAGGDAKLAPGLQAGENATLTIRLDMTIGPGGGGTVVGREQRILCRVNPSGTAGLGLISAASCTPVADAPTTSTPPSGSWPGPR